MLLVLAEARKVCTVLGSPTVFILKAQNERKMCQKIHGFLPVAAARLAQGVNPS
jgi:hypothetical protein